MKEGQVGRGAKRFSRVARGIGLIAVTFLIGASAGRTSAAFTAAAPVGTARSRRRSAPRSPARSVRSGGLPSRELGGRLLVEEPCRGGEERRLCWERCDRLTPVNDPCEHFALCRSSGESEHGACRGEDSE